MEAALSNLSRLNPYLVHLTWQTDFSFTVFSSHGGLGHFHKNPRLLDNPTGFVLSR